MECNDLDYVTITNIQKLHSTIMNSKVSKNIRNQGETLFCWAFAISTMLRQSLNLFISQLDGTKIEKDEALKKLNSVAKCSFEDESLDSASDHSDNEKDNVFAENFEMDTVDQESSDNEMDETVSVEINKIVDFFGLLTRDLNKLNELAQDSGEKVNADKNCVDEKIPDIDRLNFVGLEFYPIICLDSYSFTTPASRTPSPRFKKYFPGQ